MGLALLTFLLWLATFFPETRGEIQLLSGAGATFARLCIAGVLCAAALLTLMLVACWDPTAGLAVVAGGLVALVAWTHRWTTRPT